MAQTHTPGPWGYRRHLKTTHITSDPFRKAMQDPWYIHGPLNDSDFLADVFMKKDKSSKANAALMAAAPDLLEACKEARETMVAASHPDGDPEECTCLADGRYCFGCTIKELRAAIAKAEGRS